MTARAVAVVGLAAAEGALGWTLTLVDDDTWPVAILALLAAVGAAASVPRLASAAPWSAFVASRLARTLGCVMIHPVLGAAVLPLWLPVAEPAEPRGDPEAARTVRRIVRVATDPAARRELQGPLGRFLLDTHERASTLTAETLTRAARRQAGGRLLHAVPVVLALLLGALLVDRLEGLAMIAYVVTVVTARPAPPTVAATD
ncbi:hypothetical protein [Micromonospora echinofusca]|uniref:hypothetical protein n=1 Tax=Micromonospora echinofusca TaxID=47858 RepID=UPI0033CB50B5